MGIGRPVEFDRAAVLESAIETFWSKGYEATSLQDLLSATALSKSSLYQAFGGKQKLFEECLRQYTDRLVGRLRQRLDASDSALDFIRATLTEIASEGKATGKPRGCLITNTASEFGQGAPAFARWVTEGTSRIRAVMESALKRGQLAGEVTRAQSAARLADYVMSSIAGLRTTVKAGAKPSRVLGVVDVIVATLRLSMSQPASVSGRR